MSSAINYKQKYVELKAKFMSSVDQAFKLGYEQGMKQAQLDSMQQMAQPVNEEPVPGQENGTSDENGSELDQYIAQLESMVGNKDSSEEEVKKALDGIKSFRKNQLQQIELKKSAQAIPEISKALHKPSFKMNVIATQNMTDNSKKAVSMQQKIVTDIMEKWEKEEHKAAQEIKKAIDIEGLLKKE